MHALAKLVGFLVEPLNLLLGLLGVSAGAAVVGRRRLQHIALAAATTLGAGVALTPLPERAVRMLEDRFPPGSFDADEVAGAIVLGGAAGSGLIAEQRGTYVLNDAAERLTTAVALRRRFPDLPIVISGFSAALRPRGPSEGEVTRLLMADLGLEASAFIYEERSRNTFENAVRTRELLGEVGGEWLLVTSAFHMPRAAGTFRRAGFRVRPHPVDFRTVPMMEAWWPPDPVGRFEQAGIVAKEWVGLLAYRLLGRTDALFPAPISADGAGQPGVHGIGPGAATATPPSAQGRAQLHISRHAHATPEPRKGVAAHLRHDRHVEAP